jgi:hypothetical protein
MNRYRVHYEGTVEVEADSELEAECSAAFDCQPDRCWAELIEEGDTSESEDEDEDEDGDYERIPSR